MKNKRLQKFWTAKNVFIGLLFFLSGITKTLAQNITFADSNVKTICVTNWDTNGDGELSYSEAAAVSDMGTVFQNNAQITSFNELQYFTGLTEIDDYAFANCRSLTSAEIPQGVRQIGRYAFSNCSSLSSINIPNSVTSIETYAFQNNSDLTLITIPNGVLFIYDGAFSGCSSLTSILIPNSVIDIKNPFYNCSSLTQIIVEGGNSVYDSRGNCNAIIETKTKTLIAGCQNTVIPNSITSIKGGAFSSCTSLTSIEIPNSVTSIGNYAFSSCSGLTSIVIPNSVTSLGYAAFSGCSSLTSIEIPNSVTSLEGRTFGYCSGLISIEIPNSVTSIGDEAFQRCTSLTSIEIPNSVTSIGDEAFEHCTSLTSIEIPNSMISIGKKALYSCDGLTSITSYALLPPTLGDYFVNSSLTTIFVYVPCGTSELYQAANGWSAFTNYEEIVSGDYCPIEFADDNVKAICVAQWDTNNDGELSYAEAAAVSNIGTYFKGNTQIISFNELRYFTGLSSIANTAFMGCTSLTSATIPSSVTVLDDEAFLNCSNMTILTVNSPTPPTVNFNALSCLSGNIQIVVPCGTMELYQNAPVWSTLSINDNCIIDFSDDYVKAICVANWDINGDNELSYTEASTITDLGTAFRNNRFYSFDELQYFTGLTSIGNNSFSFCQYLTSIKIPNSVTTIGNNAFSTCVSLTSVEIPNSVTSLGSSAFANCESLTTIEIPNSVTSIGERSFSHCSSLTSIRLSTNVTTIGVHLFSDCTSLTSIEIPDRVTSIGISAFYGCSNLTSIVIPNNVTSIGNGAFYDCNSLTSIVIPSSVTSIGSNPFNNCNSLTAIMMKSITPPILEYSNAFEGTTCPIYVPYESLNTYKTATNWSTYANRIYPWMQTTIPGYGTSNGKWAFIASPLTTSTAPTAIDDMIATTAIEYDLYRFNQAGANGEWENYKVHGFDLTNGQGYLYANKSNVNLVFKGDFNENTTQDVPLSYVSGTRLAGYNLVGNPFPVNAYSSRPYYVMNADGDAVIATAISTNEPIAPCTGVIVQAMENENNPTVTFSTTAPSTSNKGNLNIMLCEVDTRRGTTGREAFIDNAIVSFNEGDQLGKFVFNEDNAKLYIPQNGKEYAIACIGDGRDAMHCVSTEVPVNFKATRNGEYTLTVNPENVEMEYLHLIDNLTGNDVDLLQTPSYTFTAKTDDYASRFRLVFSTDDDNLDNDDNFAYISNGEIRLLVETCHSASLQVIDVTGRVIVERRDAMHCVSTDGMVPGVYVLRLVNGENMKTQKIVIK